jgi:hypothetical protein
MPRGVQWSELWWPYVAFVTASQLLLHAFSRRVHLCVLGGAIGAAALTVVFEASRGALNVGWAPALFVVCLGISLPVCYLIGFTFRFVRAGRVDH